MNCKLSDSIKTLAKLLCVFAVIAMPLLLVACTCSAANHEAEDDVIRIELSDEAKQRMDANGKFLVENLTVATFSEYNLSLLLSGLEGSGCGVIVEAWADYDPAKQADYEAGEHFYAIIKDDLGNTYTAEINIRGYC